MEHQDINIYSADIENQFIDYLKKNNQYNENKDEALVALKKGLCDVYKELGNKKLKEKKTSEAILFYDAARSIYPSPNVNSNLALALIGRRDFGRAIQVCNEALESDEIESKLEAKVQLRLGTIYFKYLNDAVTAKAHIEKGLANKDADKTTTKKLNALLKSMSE